MTAASHTLPVLLLRHMPTTPSASVDKSLKPLLWLVAMGLFMQTLDSTIVNTALPAMARSLACEAARFATQELIPLSAALYVAIRYTVPGGTMLYRMRTRGGFEQLPFFSVDLSINERHLNEFSKEHFCFGGTPLNQSFK